MRDATSARDALSTIQQRERATQSLRLLARLYALGTVPYAPTVDGVALCSPLLNMVRGALAARLRGERMTDYVARALVALDVRATSRVVSTLAASLETFIPQAMNSDADKQHNSSHYRDARGVRHSVPTPTPLANGMLAMLADMALTSASVAQLYQRLILASPSETRKHANMVRTFETMLRSVMYLRGDAQACGLSDVAPASETYDAQFSSMATLEVERALDVKARIYWQALTTPNRRAQKTASAKRRETRDADMRATSARNMARERWTKTR